MLFVIAFAILFIPIRLFFPTKIIHKERLPKKEKVIVTCNHYSNLDPVICDIFFGKKFIYMAKVELYKNKFLGWFLKRIGSFPVDRQNITPSTFKQTMFHLGKKHKVFIFPEGTRNKEGTEELGDVKAGVITFASKGEAKIVPMVMYQKPRAFHKNYIIVGEPIAIVGQNPKRLSKEEVEQNLNTYTSAMNNLRQELDEYVLSKRKVKS